MTKLLPQSSLISTRHIIIAAFVIAVVFAYMGTEESFFSMLFRFEFWMNIALNYLQGFIVLYLIYYLHFFTRISFLLALLISTLTLLLTESFLSIILTYDHVQKVEMYSLTFPIGALIVFVFNYYYKLVKEKAGITDAAKSKNNEFWVNTLDGKSKLNVNEILYGELTATHLKIVGEERTISSFSSLKQLEERINNEGAFFRLNKQQLAAKKSVTSFGAQKDGRLEVTLFDGNMGIVSKNKAASFNKWMSD